jgi:hypothetical protein
VFSFEAMQILIFLLPGFISEVILNILVVRKDKNDLGKVIEALVFSVIIYGIYSLIYSNSPIELTVVNPAKDAATSTYVLSTHGIRLVEIVAFSIVIAIICGWLVTTDYHMELLRTLHVTGKTARESIWLDVFLHNKRSIIINFDDGRRIMGFPEYYSDEPESKFIYLYKPAWIVYDSDKKADQIKEIDCEGILITPEHKIDSIMFI